MRSISILLGIVLLAIIIIVNLPINESSIENPESLRNVEDIISSVSEENVNDLTTKEYAELDLYKIWKLKLDLDYLDQKYKVESIKNNSENFMPIPYRVVFKSRKRYIFVYYDEVGKYYGSEMFKKSPNKLNFDFMEIGKTKLSEVYKIDKKGLYARKIYSGWPVNSSIHFTEDGYLLTFIYDEDDILQEMIIELI